MNDLLPIVEFADFTKLDIRTGTITKATVNEKANVPAYILTIDFGTLGIKTSSAQITDHYSPRQLLGMQIVAIVNFAPKRVAGVRSEVLVLAAMCEKKGTILLQPTQAVLNGQSIA